MNNDCTDKRKTAFPLTPAAEDCLRMIFEMAFDGGESGGEGKPVRICALAERLGVSPSSASRMAQSMALWGYIDFRRYGYITVTENGRTYGGYLVRRREVVGRFFDKLCGGGNDTDADKIEHYITETAVTAMEREIAESKLTEEISAPQE